MQAYHITLAGHHVQASRDGDILTLWLPCLGGEDVTRHPDRIAISWDAPRLNAPYLADIPYSPIEVRAEASPLLGWGQLNSPCPVTLHPEDCAWYVSVPGSLWDAACEYASKVLVA